MTTRRALLTGLAATGLAPHAVWADVGSPSFLSAARLPSGAYAVIGLDGDGRALFRIPLPGRGHAAAAHPSHPVAVAFARRPGTFALMVNCMTGDTFARLEAPPGFHFSGHGTFSADGILLFTSENDFARARGAVGVWDACRGYRRIGVFPSGGTGPHDLQLMPDGKTLVVANGGIETHPETGRTKLNLPTMRPNLSYVSMSGSILEQHEPPPEWHRTSIRHLAVRPDGLVAIACQWQGAPASSPPLLATHFRGEGLSFHAGPADLERAMLGYAGSIAFSGGGKEIALTSPRGGIATIFSDAGLYLRSVERDDICGAAPRDSGFAFTTGNGEVVFSSSARKHRVAAKTIVNWDNHLISLWPDLKG